MYRFYVRNDGYEYHYAELCRVFLSEDEFEIISIDRLPDPAYLGERSHVLGAGNETDRDAIKRELYVLLENLTGQRPEWGTLTGVRPLKPALDILGSTGDLGRMKEVLKERYLIADSKADFLADIADYQKTYVNGNPSDYISVYAGIPFCPTRCEYCSFASNVASNKDIALYLDNLKREIDYTGRLFQENLDGKDTESVYIGGGTPTTLSAVQLAALIDSISDAFSFNPQEKEFTVEAGRPDTITKDKLETLRYHGIGRISINPQSMKDETLKTIGRDHTSDDIRRAFALADSVGFDVINADLIAGLPDESASDFKTSLDEIIDLGAENITIHTLSVKRGSRLHEHDPLYYRRDIERVSEMLSYAREKLSSMDYYPYYIYRQKHQIGAFENVGYCRPGTHSIYNIRIMEDKQSIIALGAGAVGKVYYPDEDRIERIANVSNYKIYSERINEMLERKKNYFGGYNGD